MTLWHSPTGAFTAVNPPRWMTEDLVRFEPLVGETRVLVLFSDDLPGQPKANGEFSRRNAATRYKALCEVAEESFGHSTEELCLNVKDLAVCTAGMVVDNGASKIEPNPKSTLPGCSHGELVYQAADRAVISLPPRSRDAYLTLETFSGLDRQLFASGLSSKINPHRTALRHEIEHLVQFSQPGNFVLPRAAERGADDAAMDFCHGDGDSPSAFFMRACRTLSNFLSEPGSDNFIYWHSLHQYGVKTSNAEEMGSQLELKLRAAGMAHVVDRPSDQLAQMLLGNDDNKAAFARRMQYEGTTASPFSRLRTLKTLHSQNGYRYKHSRFLAETVIETAQRLTPGVF